MLSCDNMMFSYNILSFTMMLSDTMLPDLFIMLKYVDSFITIFKFILTFLKK
jgi:hypothetical protein